MGNEWEIYKENVRPLKRGRNVTLFNEALKSQQDAQIKKTLIETRRKVIEAIEEYEGDDPLQAWLEQIKQGKQNQLSVAYALRMEPKNKL